MKQEAPDALASESMSQQDNNMGCWNKTCGLTNLPITYDDRVITFLIGGRVGRCLPIRLCY